MYSRVILASCIQLILFHYLREVSGGNLQRLGSRYNNSSYSPRRNSTSKLNTANTVAAGYLFADNTDERLNLTDAIDANLLSILNRHGPDMRSSRDYKDFKDVSLNVSIRAWELLHVHASKAIAERIDLARPAIEQLLKDARVSKACVNSTRSLFEGAINMESWAIKLINSWGSFPPAAIFEGTYGEIGSYHTCVNIPKNDRIDHAHYCSLHFRPIIPSREDYELVINHMPERLSNFFENKKSLNRNVTDRGQSSRDAFTDILEHAQYHHFVYYKWGTCWPINCSPFDIKRVTKLIGRRNMLTNGPVKCFSKHKGDYEEPGSIEPIKKQGNSSTRGPELKKLVISTWDLNDGIFISKPYFLTTQKVALAILALITSIILFMTNVDLFIVRLPRLYKMLKVAIICAPRTRNEITLNLKQPTDQGLDENCTNTNDTIRQDETVPLQANSAATTATKSTGVQTSPDCKREEVLYQMVASEAKKKPQPTGFMRWVDDCSIIANASQFLEVSQGQLKNDILCLNGIRCITMGWICLTHTMMYCDYSGFARTRMVEKSLKSPLGQPLFNGSYLVDSFFLVSGLLGAFTSFKGCKGDASKFNVFSYIVGRYLRLTPQICLVNILFILFPAISEGPHWYPLVAEYSENCVNNWWINVFHMQAFFDVEKMCNFVTWWVSIDFFYHIIALSVILATLWGNHKIGFIATAGLVVSQVTWQIVRHYQLGLPPNMLSTIPQTGAMWSSMTLSFYWKPYAHTVPYFFGFYIGYLMAMKQKLIVRFLTPRRVVIGWTLSTSGLVIMSYSTYWWVSGLASYSRWQSTLFYTICPIIWASAFCWIIVACHHGHGGFVNRFLSMRAFIILGKASYFIYLSHFQIMFLFFGNANILLEPSELIMLYIILGNIFLSTIYGILLCVIYESPWLKIHKRLMKYVALVGKRLC